MPACHHPPPPPFACTRRRHYRSHTPAALPFRAAHASRARLFAGEFAARFECAARPLPRQRPCTAARATHPLHPPSLTCALQRLLVPRRRNSTLPARPPRAARRVGPSGLTSQSAQLAARSSRLRPTKLALPRHPPTSLAHPPAPRPSRPVFAHGPRCHRRPQPTALRRSRSRSRRPTLGASACLPTSLLSIYSLLV